MRWKAWLWVIIGLCSILYGFSVMALGSGSGFFLFWIALGLLFFLMAGVMWSGFWKRLPKWFLRTFVACLSLGIALFIILEGCIISGFFERGKENLDYIIVLGAQVYEHGPSVVLRYRLDKAVEYLEDNPRTKCIVAGGEGYNEPFPEAEGMAEYLRIKGIDDSRIFLEKESSTTAENIRNSMQYLENDSSVGIITNNFHVFRAVQIGKKQGLQNACGISADSHVYFLLNNMTREFLALLKFYIMGMFAK